MSNKNPDFYKERLTEIREVLNILYKRGEKSSQNTIVFIKNKFDSNLRQVNINILKNGLLKNNSDNDFTLLCQKYINIIECLHREMNELIIARLLKIFKIESDKIDLENQAFESLMSTLPNIPNTINSVNNITIKII